MTAADLRALVQRLREDADAWDVLREPDTSALQRESADAIESLLARAESAEAECARLRQDAERYRWLRAEHDRVEPIARTVWKLHHDRRGSEWCDIAGPSELDAAIDRAIAEGRT